jgi:hypothetical protein
MIAEESPRSFAGGSVGLQAVRQDAGRASLLSEARLRVALVELVQ